MAKPKRRSDTAGKHVVRSPAFGRSFTEALGKRSPGVLLQRIKADYGIAMDRAVLYRYKKGKIASPDFLFLWALSRIVGTHWLDRWLILLHREHHPGAAKRVEAEESVAMARLTSEQQHILDRFERLNTAQRRQFHTLLDVIGKEGTGAVPAEAPFPSGARPRTQRRGSH